MPKKNNEKQVYIQRNIMKHFDVLPQVALWVIFLLFSFSYLIFLIFFYFLQKQVLLGLKNVFNYLSSVKNFSLGVK